MKYSNTFLMLLIVVTIVVLLFLNLVLGSVSIPLQSVWHIIFSSGEEPVTWQNIIWKSRFPQALTALVAGAGLSISGLQMQTVFRNPLAGPSVLGISSGGEHGCCLCRPVEWQPGRCGAQQAGVHGGDSPVGCSRDRFFVCDGSDRICLAESKKEM